MTLNLESAKKLQFTDDSPKKKGAHDSEETSDYEIFTKFDDPLKFWNYQMSFDENQRRIYKESPVFTEECCSTVMKGVLNGLASIHDMGFIHRDIKPENVMISPRNSPVKEEEVKIIDFGLALKQKYSLFKKQSEGKVGTLLYMAPEQIN